MILAFEVTAAGPVYKWHAAGDGSGFGNQPAVATITFGGTVRYTCQNKGGNRHRDKIQFRQSEAPLQTSATLTITVVAFSTSALPLQLLQP
jgi:hypothetical protein